MTTFLNAPIFASQTLEINSYQTDLENLKQYSNDHERFIRRNLGDPTKFNAKMLGIKLHQSIKIIEHLEQKLQQIKQLTEI